MNDSERDPDGTDWNWELDSPFNGAVESDPYGGLEPIDDDDESSTPTLRPSQVPLERRNTVEIDTNELNALLDIARKENPL